MPISIAQNKDCMEAMAEFPDKFFDLAIVDPPYGIDAANMQMGNNAPSRGGKSSAAVEIKKNRSDNSWDKLPPSEFYFKELSRVSKYQIIWGGNYFDLPPTRGIVVWDKEQPWTNFSQVELAWSNFDKPARIFKLSNTGGAPDNMRKNKKIHPTQKPVILYTWLLQNYAQPGWKILDTHLGSGSSRIAAFNLGFDFWGYEIDKDYFEAQEKRFNGSEAKLFNI